MAGVCSTNPFGPVARLTLIDAMPPISLDRSTHISGERPILSFTNPFKVLPVRADLVLLGTSYSGDAKPSNNFRETFTQNSHAKMLVLFFTKIRSAEFYPQRTVDMWIT